MKEDQKHSPLTARPVRSLRDDMQGAGLVEYIILVGVIALLAVAGFNQFGSNVHQKAINLGSQVTNIGN